MEFQRDKKKLVHGKIFPEQKGGRAGWSGLVVGNKFRRLPSLRVADQKLYLIDFRTTTGIATSAEEFLVIDGCRPPPHNDASGMSNRLNSRTVINIAYHADPTIQQFDD